MNATTSSSNETEETDPIIPPSEVQFWTFLIFQIPSLACTLFLLYHLLTNRKLRQALNNHVVIILLILGLAIEIFDNPLYIDAYRLGGHNYSFPMTPTICLMWWILDYGFYGAITVFLAWGSIERHLLVFHHRQCLRTQKQKLLLHYLPLILLSLYLIGFYIGVILFPPCENQFDYQSLGCGFSPCYEEISFLNVWDYLINGIMFGFIETIFSSILLIRVVALKRRARQSLNWKKHRRMAFQLLSISFLTLTIVFPQSLIIIVQKLGGSELANFGATLDPYFFYFYNYVVFLLPFICLGSLPELWPKLGIARLKRHNRISHITLIAEQGQSIFVQPRNRPSD